MAETLEAFGGAFRGRRVFLTGHTGFKGGWLALWLAELGAEVHGYALEPPTTPSLFEDAAVHSVLASHTVGDVRDAARLRRALADARAEIVIHMAAQPLVRLSYDAPAETYAVNVMGTVHLLDAVRAAGTVRVCQVVTSDKCYENREWVYGYRENDPMGGFDPYSSSKGCAELVVSAYRRSFFPVEALEGGEGVSVSSVRAGNVIGGGDWAQDRIIPDCVRALVRGESILVRNPRAVRPWQHVLEPLAGYLHLAATQWSRPALGADGWNFGPAASGSVPVAEIVDALAAEWGGGRWHTPEPGAAASHEANLLKLDITKAQTLLGWRPVYEVGEAVAETSRWYRARHEAGAGFDAGSFCRAQIARYQRRAAEAGSAWAPRAE